MRTDIIVQNVATFRIDPALLRRPERRTILVTSVANNARLLERRREDAFDAITVLPNFDAQSLLTAARSVMAGLPAAEREDVRLVTHDEYSLLPVANIRQELRIPGDQPHQLEAFSDKRAMKQALEGSGVRIPRWVAWDDAQFRSRGEAYAREVLVVVGLPAFVKPARESGSVGAQAVSTLDELVTWAQRADPQAGWEVDELIMGVLYHVDSLVRGQEFLHVAVNENLYPCADYTRGRLSASFPVPDDDPHRAALIDLNRQVLDALPRPHAGAFHLEVFRRPDNELVFLEIAARPPAALIPFTSQIRFGINIEDAHFRLQRGEDITVPNTRGPYSAYAYLPKRAGIVTNLERPHLSSDHRWTWNVQVGERMANPEDIRDFAASVLLWNDDYTHLREDLALLEEADVIQAQDV